MIPSILFHSIGVDFSDRARRAVADGPGDSARSGRRSATVPQETVKWQGNACFARLVRELARRRFIGLSRIHEPLQRTFYEVDCTAHFGLGLFAAQP